MRLNAATKKKIYIFYLRVKEAKRKKEKSREKLEKTKVRLL